MLRQVILQAIFSAALLSSQTVGAALSVAAASTSARALPARGVPIADSSEITAAVAELRSLVASGEDHDPFSSPDLYQQAAKLQEKIYRHRLGLRDGEPTPTHVWFDAIAKTELSAALPLMMSLVKRGILVTYTAGGGFFIKRSEAVAPPRGYLEHTNIPVELEEWNASPIRDQNIGGFSTRHFYIPPSEEGLDDGSLPVIPGYEVWHCQGPDAGQITKLRNAGVRVFIKKQAAPHMEAQLDSQKGAENSSRAWWSSKVFPAAVAGPENAVLPAPSFLTVDALCHGHWASTDPAVIMASNRNAFGLLGVGAGLPGATWCGNTGLMQCGRVQAEAMNHRLLSCMEDGRGAMDERMNVAELDSVEDRMTFAGLHIRPVFVASCLGWHGRAPDMVGKLPADDFRGHTRSSFKTEGTGARIDTTMVSQLKRRDGKQNSEEKRLVDLSRPRIAGGKGDCAAYSYYPKPSLGPYAEEPDIKKIHEKLVEQGANLLVFIAFGTQGFDFAREALNEILFNAAAVEHSLVYLVLPTGWSILEEAPSGNLSDNPQSGFMPAAGKASRARKPVTIIRGSDPASRIVLADNMMAVPFPAPQGKIFEAFSPLSQKSVKMMFISHGGAGSIAEAVGRRIPILGLGLGVDQPGNCTEVAEFGLGLDGRRLVNDLRVNRTSIESPGGHGSCLWDIFSYSQDKKYNEGLLSPEKYLVRKFAAEEEERALVREKTEGARLSPRGELLAIAAKRSSEHGSPVFDIFRGLGYIRDHWAEFQENFASQEGKLCENTMHNGAALTEYFIEVLKETTLHGHGASAPDADAAQEGHMWAWAWASASYPLPQDLEEEDLCQQFACSVGLRSRAVSEDSERGVVVSFPSSFLPVLVEDDEDGGDNEVSDGEDTTAASEASFVSAESVSFEDSWRPREDVFASSFRRGKGFGLPSSFRRLREDNEGSDGEDTTAASEASFVSAESVSFEAAD